MKRHISTYFLAATALVMLIAGCGGSGGSTPPPPQTISVAFSPAAPNSVSAGSMSSLTAAVSNDSANAGVKWSVTCGSSQCGSYSATTTANGAATQYSAPSTVPSPTSVTVTATSVTDSTKSVSATITITTPPPPAHVLNDGNYVYHVSGEDGSGPYFLAGAFTVQNSVITGGEQDMIDDNGDSQDNLVASGSSMSIQNGNIQIVLNTGDASVGVNGVETFRGTVVSSARVLLSEYDTFATDTGSIDQQTSTAAPAGGYAFNLGGLDGLNPQNTLVVGGILNISGASIAVGNSVLDYNDGGNIAQAQSFASGTVGAPDAFGRVLLRDIAACKPDLVTGQVRAVELLQPRSLAEILACPHREGAWLHGSRGESASERLQRAPERELVAVVAWTFLRRKASRAGRTLIPRRA